MRRIEPDDALFDEAFDASLAERPFAELLARISWKESRAAGGAGSGNFGHAGRPGEVGGSAPDGEKGDTQERSLGDVRSNIDTLRKQGRLTEAQQSAVQRDYDDPDLVTIFLDSVPRVDEDGYYFDTRGGVVAPDGRYAQPGKEVPADFWPTQAPSVAVEEDIVRTPFYQQHAQQFQDWGQGWGPTNQMRSPDTKRGRAWMTSLRQLPDHSGTVYRGDAVTKKELEAFRRGGEWEMSRTSSSSKDEAWGRHFMWDSGGSETKKDQRVLFEIETRTGKDISPHVEPDIQEEQEVVLLAGTKYDIAGEPSLESDRGEKFYRIRLRERSSAARSLGGAGSGNFGHAGRPGEVGGSAAVDASKTAELDGIPRDGQVTYAGLDKRFPVAGDVVDGRTFGSNVPNMPSISASLNSYEILKGIREVKVSDFENSGKPSFYSATEEKRVNALAAEIEQSKQTTPLIVVVDNEVPKWPYILEGGHRFDALTIIGAKSFPALVVVDTEGLEVS